MFEILDMVHGILEEQKITAEGAVTTKQNM